VEVEVVEAEVGEAADGEPDAVDPADRERVAGDLHDHRGDLLLDRGGQDALQVGGLGGGAHARHDGVAEAGLDGADQAGDLAGRAQAGLDQVGGRGLARGAGDADHPQPGRRVAVDRGGGRAEDGARIIDHERGKVAGRERTGRVGQDGHRAGRDGRRDELGAVPVGARESRVEITGANRLTAVGDAGDLHVGAGQRGRQQLR